MHNQSDMILEERIAQKIFIIRGKKVMLDRDLGYLYGVETRILNQAVKRNIKRFPEDFMFQLTQKEVTEVITNCDNLKNLKFAPASPYAFTEHGIAMLSGILRSESAIKMNIEIIRAFIALRNLSLHYSELSDKINELEIRCDLKFSTIDQALDYLLSEKELEKAIEKRNRIGFKTND